jgi:cell division protein FtsQ
VTTVAPPRRPPSRRAPPAVPPRAARRATPTRRVAIDPRLGARRVAVRRDERQRRRRRLLAGLGVVALVSLAVGLVWSPFLAVHRIVVRGAGTHTAAVRQAAHLGTGGPLLLVHTGTVAAHVEQLPWIGSAHVERQLPNTITITVTVRAPVAWAPAGPGRVVLVDSHGVVAAVATAAPFGLPELTALTHVGGLGGRIAPTAPAAAAAALAPAFGPRLVSVALTPIGLTATVAGSPEVLLGDATALAAKAHAAAAVLGALVHPATYLDVSVPGAPVAG